ncbi:hypothetical protein BAE44_0019707 [Dichanthelium oligosanthes]|uniref:Uncharacterized protein n=1 Tax=Dichanthelium oligosanthes TaxID=888268 RepID=A0A1E5V2K3_9POAL|nr:hypothetical protein BAE44_0019707 [Dichanthelium oligosanthes]
MSMLGSYTLLSGARPLPGKLSHQALQLRKPLAASVALPCVPFIPCKQHSRAPRFVCYAEKNTYNIQPGGGNNWSITEDNTHVTLKFNVGDKTSQDKLSVTTTEDLVHLVIKYTGDPKDDSPASEMDVRLLMPYGYDCKQVTASIGHDGWLHVIITKPKPHNIGIK